MKNVSLYRLPSDTSTPIFQELEQKIVWPKNELKKGTILLYLRDLDLERKHLPPWSVDVVGLMVSKVARTMSLASTTVNVVDILEQAAEEAEKTGKIKGSLFLGPNLEKIWLSHYDIKEGLKEISP